IPSPSCLPCQSNYANNSDDNVLHRKENGNIVIQGRIGEKLQNIMFALIILKNVALKRMENYEVKDEGDRTYPSREAMEDDDEDPLAMCNENLFGDSALPVGGEYETVRDILGSRSQIRNGVCSTPPLIDGNYIALGKTKVKGSESPVRKDQAAENESQFPKLNTAKREGDRTYPSREAMEEDDEEEIKPPFEVFLNPEEVPIGEVKQEQKDPLAMCNENLFGDSALPVGGEYETVRDILGSRTHIRNGGCSTPPRIDGNYIALGKTKLWELMELVTYSVYAEEELKPRVAAAALAVGVQRADLPVPDRHLADRLRHLQEHGVPGRRRHAVAVALQSRAGAVLHTGGSQLLL
ncbi:Protein of unknown function, partial [Gryllus bimaculatus]